MYLQPTITITETIDLIKDKIKTNTPFALSRFGDGEIRILNRNSTPQHQERTCRNWGYKYPNEVQQLYTDASSIILSAIKHSDVIGIMDDTNDIAKSIYYTKEVWSINDTFLKDNGIVHELEVCDHMLSRTKEFGKPENFKDILQGRSLNIISPNTQRLESKNLSKLFDADVTFTPHPMNVNLRNRREFINSFRDIKSDVVLVGCGVQKDYVSYLKHNYGKVAIDVGAMLDAWAGIRSRPWFHKGGKQEYLVL